MKTIEQRIETVLERFDGHCLDNEAQRNEIKDALIEMVGQYLADRE